MAGATLLLASCGAPGDAVPGAGVVLDCERHDFRRALVLDPFLWEWSPPDLLRLPEGGDHHGAH